jgi:hypothetical protein
VEWRCRCVKVLWIQPEVLFADDARVSTRCLFRSQLVRCGMGVILLTISLTCSQVNTVYYGCECIKSAIASDYVYHKNVKVHRNTRTLN